MKIRLVALEDNPDYIQSARRETVRADAANGRPIGMAESAFYDQAYSSYATSPYRDLTGIEALCPIREMTGFRTIWVEPEFRVRRPVYVALYVAMARLLVDLGARFALLTTLTSAHDLMRLYERSGARRFGEIDVDVFDGARFAVYLLDLPRLADHPRPPRLLADFEVDWGKARAIRARPGPGSGAAGYALASIDSLRAKSS